MKLTLHFAQALEKLMNGGEINYGDFQGKNRQLLEKFIDDGILDYTLIGTQRKRIKCNHADNLASYLHHKFEIPSLSSFISYLKENDGSRSEAVRATSDSKYKNTTVFEGFLINAIEAIDCVLQGRSFKVSPTKGAFSFICDIDHFTIPADVTVVGVEGHENFREVLRQGYLFKDIKPLFVWRYQNSAAIARWLNLIPNKYLHFGDYDLKGLHIYVSEFRNKIGAEKCNLLVPDDLEQLMFLHGEKKLYENQVDYIDNVIFENVPEVKPVLDIIRKYKKGLAQEVLIR